MGNGMTLGKRIFQARTEAGLNQSELARAIKVTPTVVSCWESGHYKPRPASLDKVAEALKVSRSFLEFGPEDDEEDDAVELLTVPEVLAQAKAQIAALLGVPLNRVKLDMSLTG